MIGWNLNIVLFHSSFVKTCIKGLQTQLHRFCCYNNHAWLNTACWLVELNCVWFRWIELFDFIQIWYVPIAGNHEFHCGPCETLWSSWGIKHLPLHCIHVGYVAILKRATRLMHLWCFLQFSNMFSCFVIIAMLIL